MNSGHFQRSYVSLSILLVLWASVFIGPVIARDLKIATYNVTKIGATAGGSTERVFRGLTPDVALLQEWDMDGEWYARPYVDAAFGETFEFYLGDAPSVGTGWQQNNGIVSRWTILTSGSWANFTDTPRSSFAWAEIDLPGETDLLAVSVHMAAAEEDVALREDQAGLIKGYIDDYVAGGFSGYIIVGGDLNAQVSNEAEILEFETFLNPRTHRPQDRYGNMNTNFGRDRPYDWIMPCPALDAHHTPLIIGTEDYQYSQGIVFDSAIFWREDPPENPRDVLWNLPPTRYGDSRDSRVDHLAVMKAFDLDLPPTPVPTSTPVPTPSPVPTVPRPPVLKIATYNVTKIGATAGGSTERVFRGLTPDVALLQEWDMDGEWYARPYVDAAFGETFEFYLGDAPSVGTGWQQNNGIVSRWTILTSGSWANFTDTPRSSFAWAEIDLPGETDLLAVSVHMAAAEEDVALREDQAGLIKGYIDDYVAGGFSGYIIVGGDLNAQVSNEAEILEFETFLNPRTHRPQDRYGNMNTNFGRDRPYDWIMPCPALDAHHTPLIIGTEDYQYSQGIVFDSAIFWREDPPENPRDVLWNLPPTRYSDSRDSRVDHLAVMKAFDIFPLPTPSPTIAITPVPSSPTVTPEPPVPGTPTPRPTATPEIVSGPIWGRVYDRETGVGIPNIYILATNPGMGAGDYSNSEGYYFIRTVNIGTYLVAADTFNQPIYRKQYYNQKDSENQATLVRSNTGGIDFPLYRRGVYPTPPPSPTPVFFHSAIDTADYDGDGTSDLAIFRPAFGLWAVRGLTRAYFGRGGDFPVSGDYTGDGTSNLAIFRGSSGLWAVRGVTRAYFGRHGDMPVPGDYRGQGTAGFALFRPASGLWAIRNLTRVYFGCEGDLPAPFKGGGWEKEIAIFRPATGLWAVREATRAYFGSPGDLSVPGNYPGIYPGAIQFGVFRADSGLWAIRDWSRIYFGTAEDRPVPGNYRGTVQANPAIFRPANGFWAVKDLTRVYFGQPGDLPVSGLAVNPSGTISF